MDNHQHQTERHGFPSSSHHQLLRKRVRRASGLRHAMSPRPLLPQAPLPKAPIGSHNTGKRYRQEASALTHRCPLSQLSRQEPNKHALLCENDKQQRHPNTLDNAANDGGVLRVSLLLQSPADLFSADQPSSSSASNALTARMRRRQAPSSALAQSPLRFAAPAGRCSSRLSYSTESESDTMDDSSDTETEYDE